MSVSTRHLRRCAAVACAVAACVPLGQAEAATVPAPLALSALTGPGGTQLYVTAAGATPLDHVHVRVFRPDAPAETSLSVNLKNVTPEDGLVTVGLRREPAGSAVVVTVQTRETGSKQAELRRGRTIVRLRPDLTVAAVHAPPQTLSTRPIDVVADLAELNGDVGATATVTLMLGPTPVADARLVTLSAGGRRSIAFEDVELTSPLSTRLTVVVRDATPFETDDGNNSGTVDVEVTEHELVRSNVLVPSLGGYGAQLNQHVYAPITNAPPEGFPDLEAKLKALEPQLVRIFYNDNWEERRADAPENMASFIRTVQLAHDAGATINITYQTASVARLNPVPSMTRFAAVLEDLVVARGLSSVRWVTVQNEPNTPTAQLTLEQYEALYRVLDAQLVARGLREHVRLMGGDLIESSGARHQEIWFEYIEEHMNDVLDAYSVHIYWNYFDIPRMEFRLKDVRRIVTEEIAPEARKPTYIMEFATRGVTSFPGKPTVSFAYFEDGTEMRKTNVAAFQQLWFNIVAAQLGYTGTSKWDAYWGLYDGSSVNNQSYWMFGTAAEGWPVFPSYFALQLLFQTTQRGWEVVQVAPWAEDDWKLGHPDQPEKELVAYAGAGGHMTLVGLDTRARVLNAVSEETPVYSIGGLPPSVSFGLALWNESGNGENSLSGTVTTDAAGVARFAVPLHAAFSLTTVPVS